MFNKEARPIATVTIDMITAKVFLDEGDYSVFFVGDSVTAFNGSFRLLRTVRESWIG